MKHRIGKKIAVLISAILLSLPLASCGCRHEVLKWKVLTESTCTTEGKRQGPCIKCGEIIKEAISTDPEAHVYGEWEIEKMPDYTPRGVGKAVKTCTENPEHKFELTIPRLNEEDNYAAYTSAEITKASTVLEEGERTLVYAHELGDVRFIIPVEKRTFDPSSETAVEDAVLLGVSGHSQIRRGTGKINEGMASGEDLDFTYVYGEDYTYTWDQGMNREQWTSLTSDGRLFGVYLEKASFTTPRENPTVSADDLQGYSYTIRRVNYTTFYGAEGLLNGVYEWGKSANNNRDYWESVKEEDDGKTYFRFGFGYYSPSNRYFSTLALEFTLNDELIMDYIRLDTDTYTSDRFEVSHSDDGKVVTCKLKSGAQPLYKEYISYNQVTKAEEPDEPEHEYTEENFKITGFDISYGGKQFTDNAEESPELSARSSDSTGMDSLTISGVQPSTASFTFDPLTVYRIMDNGSRVLLDYASTRGNIAVRLQSNSVLAIKLKEAGTITLLLKTQSGFEKTIRFKSLAITPSTLYPSVNEYFDAGYVWRTELDNRETLGGSTGYTIKETVIYTDQPLEFRSIVPVSETKYADPGFSARVLTSNKEYSRIEQEEGALTATFKASKAGSYIIEMRSNLNSGVRSFIRVTVEDAPTRETILSGVYEGKIIRPSKNNVRLTFSAPNEDGKIEALYEVLAKERNADGELEEIVESWEKLYVYYDDENDELVCERVPGEDGGADKGIRLEINEAYRLVLVYPTGGFGGNTLKSVLNHPEPSDAESGSESGSEAGSESGATA